MKLVQTEQGGLAIGDKVYDKMTFEYGQTENPFDE